MHSPSDAELSIWGPLFETLWSREIIRRLFREDGRGQTEGGLECHTQ